MRASLVRPMILVSLFVAVTPIDSARAQSQNPQAIRDELDRLRQEFESLRALYRAVRCARGETLPHSRVGPVRRPSHERHRPRRRLPNPLRPCRGSCGRWRTAGNLARIRRRERDVEDLQSRRGGGWRLSRCRRQQSHRIASGLQHAGNRNLPPGHRRSLMPEQTSFSH